MRFTNELSDLIALKIPLMTILLMETSAIEVVPLAGVVLSFKRAVERIGCCNEEYSY